MSLAYFPLFPADFDADTGHLTFAEDGVYNRLLRLSWRCHDAKMPDDLDWICRKARAVSPEDRALVEAVLAEFFTRKAGKVFSKRLAEEYVKASTAHAKRILAGSSGGKAKSMKLNKVVASNATAMLKQPEPEPEPEPELYLFGSNEPHKTCATDKKIDTGFERFWSAYPLKKAKAAAEKNWAKAIKKAAPEIIIAAAERYSQSRDVARGFAKYAQGWLSDERWKDGPEPQPSDPEPARNYGGHRRSEPWGEVVR